MKVKKNLNSYERAMKRKFILPTGLIIFAIIINLVDPVYKNGSFGYGDFLQWLLVFMWCIYLLGLYNIIPLNLPTVPMVIIYVIQLIFHIVFHTYPINWICWFLGLVINISAYFALDSFWRRFMYVREVAKPPKDDKDIGNFYKYDKEEKVTYTEFK